MIVMIILMMIVMTVVTITVMIIKCSRVCEGRSSNELIHPHNIDPRGPSGGARPKCRCIVMVMRGVKVMVMMASRTTPVSLLGLRLKCR